MSILERPALREYAATCNDPSGFEVRKHVHEAPAKTRHPDDCEATQTGSVRGWKGARQLPPDRISVAFLRATERRGSFVMGATRCPRGSSSTRADLIEITSPPPGGARRRGRHGAHRAMHEAFGPQKPRQATREGHSRGCLLEMQRPARPLELSWAPRRSPPTVNGRSRHPRAAPTRTS